MTIVVPSLGLDDAAADAASEIVALVHLAAGQPPRASPPTKASS
ncbi:MAG: hypothetical protein ABSF62_02220 [Bryobacteraceae bacterium]